jgi:hypothetical protein
MACLRLRAFVACVASASLFVSSTGAVAATSSIPMPAVQQVNPWATLSALSGAAPAAALCGAAAAAAAAVQAPPGCVLPVVDAAPVVTQGPPPPTPVPPVEPVGGGFGLGINPLYLALGALLIGGLIYFLLIKKDKDDDDDVSPD